MAETERAIPAIPNETKCKILVVDDQAVIRKFIGQIVNDRFKDFEFFEAEDGEEAWEFFKKSEPNIVITDVCMPRMDGIDLLRRIRRHSRDVEVIMVTGFAETKMVVDALKAGASNFIEKPFTVDSIEMELSRFLARWKAAREMERLEGELERERSLREASARLATAGRLMAGIAVEIRNPLTWIKGNAELITEMLSGESAKSAIDSTTVSELLADIRAGAEAIEDQLALIRRYQGLASISEDRDVSLARLLNDSALLASGKRPANVTLDVAPPPPNVSVRLHPVEMESCLVNLVVNAFESVKATGGAVTITSEIFSGVESGGWAELAIKAKRTTDTVVRLGREKQDSDSSFWLWAAHKAAEHNGVFIELTDAPDGAFTALVRLPWFDEGEI